LQRFLAHLPADRVGRAYKRDILRALRMVYAWGLDTGLVDRNPAKRVQAPRPARGERIIPFESWAEVEAVAEECRR
jgi:integrase